MKKSIFSYIFGYGKTYDLLSESDSFKNKTYEEICNFHRFFLNWRHALFAGDIVVTGYIFNKIIEIKDKEGWWVLVPMIFGFTLAIISKQFDQRIHEIYNELIQVGYELEGKTIGNFHALIKTPKKITHSQTIEFFYWFSIIGYAVILIFWILGKFNCFPNITFWVK